MRLLDAPPHQFGIELGDPSGPRARCFVQRLGQPDPLVAVSRELCSSPLIWKPFEGARGRRANGRLVGHRGDGKRASVELIQPSNMELTEALYRIEEKESDAGVDVPPELIGVLLVTGRGLATGIEPSRLSVAATSFASLLAGVSQGTHGSISPRLSQKEIHRLVQEISPRDFVVQGRGLHASGRSVDMARLMLAWSEDLWRDRWVRLGRSVGSEKDHDIEALSILASIDLLLRREPAVVVSGIRLPMSTEIKDFLHAWSQAVELCASDLETEALRTLIPDHVFPGGSWSGIPVGLSLSAEKTDLLRGLMKGLVEEAERAPAYIPIGVFYLAIPAAISSDWATCMRRLSIVADPHGFWVRAAGQKHGPVFRWTPKEGVRALALRTDDAALLSTTLAALWRDLRIAGQEAIPESEEGLVHTRSNKRESSPQRIPAVPGSHAKDPPRHGRMVPQPRRLVVSGRHNWGTADERESVILRAHGVRGHLRKLKPQHKPGQAALTRANDFGVILPQGYTFVRPYWRGREGKKENASPAAMPIRSRGLATLLTFMQDITK